MACFIVSKEHFALGKDKIYQKSLTETPDW